MPASTCRARQSYNKTPTNTPQNKATNIPQNMPQAEATSSWTHRTSTSTHPRTTPPSLVFFPGRETGSKLQRRRSPLPLTVLGGVGGGVGGHLPSVLVHLLLPLLPSGAVDLRRGDPGRLRGRGACDAMRSSGASAAASAAKLTAATSGSFGTYFCVLLAIDRSIGRWAGRSQRDRAGHRRRHQRQG